VTCREFVVGLQQQLANPPSQKYLFESILQMEILPKTEINFQTHVFKFLELGTSFSFNNF